MENENKNEVLNDSLKEISSHCQKLTEALYRITDLFPSKEPLKWILREECVKIFQLFLFLESASFNKKINSFDKIFEKIEQFVSLLEIAAANSFIAEMNFNVLKREYLNLKNSLDVNRTLCLPSAEKIIGNAISDKSRIENSEKARDKSLNSLFSTNILTESLIMDIQSSIGHQEPEENIAIGHLPSVAGNADCEAGMKWESSRKSVSSQSRNREIATEGEPRTSQDEEWGRQKQTGRENKILNIIYSKPQRRIGVNEVFAHFKGISKKTIQRELTKLVYEGVLKAEGEKRWRKYMLIKS